MCQVYNCIVVIDKEVTSSLFCRRMKDPFKGQYNFVGGKVEEGEDPEAAAYRELLEETGITRDEIRLFRVMDIRYYQQGFILEIYAGKLNREVILREELNPLLWMSLEEDFTDKNKFAGKQNIAHIMNIALQNLNG